MLKPPDGYREFTVNNKNWQLGALYYDLTDSELRENGLFKGAVWFDRQQFISIKPGEDWRTAYEIKNGPMTKDEKEHLHCFLSINLHGHYYPENANV